MFVVNLGQKTQQYKFQSIQKISKGFNLFLFKKTSQNVLAEDSDEMVFCGKMQENKCLPSNSQLRVSLISVSYQITHFQRLQIW